MSVGTFIRKNPLFLLTLSLIAGIVTGWLCDVSGLHTAVAFALSATMLVAGLFSFAPKWLFGAGTLGALFSIGVFIITCDKQGRQVRWHEEKMCYEAQLIENPYMGDRTIRVLANVVLRDSVVGDIRREGCVQLYFANCVEADRLQVGDRIFFEAVVKNPSNRGNPAEFDSERYMRIKGITGQTFLPINGWGYSGKGDMTLQMHALALRDKVVQMYERLGFAGDELSLLSAFTVGEKRGFSQRLKEAYSSAGVSHVLALSGLHLGIFYMVLAAIFSLFGHGRVWFVVRELLILCFLWGFAMIAGFTPSVVRSALLFSIVSLGRCMRRESSSVSSLSFAAMLMLVFSPRLLFDIGFQLSFSAVLAILLLVPWFQRLLRYDSYGSVYKYFSSAVAVSLAAQLGVLPFVWYYFGTFPFYFLFANIFVVPLSTLLMSLALLLCVLSPLPFLQGIVALPLALLLKMINAFVAFTAELPAASCLLPEIGAVGAVFIALGIICFLYGAAARKWWLVVVVSITAIVSLLLNIFAFDDGRKGNYLLLFNNTKSSAVLAVADDGSSYCLSSIPRLDTDCDRVVQPFVDRERLDAPRWASDGFADERLQYSEGLISFAGVRVWMLADDCWMQDSVQRSADALLLCRGFLGAVDKLLSVHPANCIILDGSLYAGSRRRLLRECSKLDIPCIDISQLGAVKIIGVDGSFSVATMRGK